MTKQTSVSTNLSRVITTLLYGLPFVVPLGIFFIATPIALMVLKFQALGFTLFVAWHIAQGITHKLLILSLGSVSSAQVVSGSPRGYMRGEMLYLVVLSVLMAFLVMDFMDLPFSFSQGPLLSIAMALAVMAGIWLQTSRRGALYWFKTCLVYHTKVIGYEDIESLIYVPWQGFDIRLRKSGRVLEVRRSSQVTVRLLDELGGILTPHGIKIQGKPSSS